MTKAHSISHEQILACFDQAVQQTFEAYFFLDVRPAKDRGALDLAAGDGLEIDASFKGPFSGRLHIQVSKETAVALTCSLPLESGEVNPEMMSDLFAEITNTIGGRIAAALAGDDFAFDLTIPETRFGKLSPHHGQALSQAYLTDFGTVVLSVTHLEEHQHQHQLQLATPKGA